MLGVDPEIGKLGAAPVGRGRIGGVARRHLCAWRSTGLRTNRGAHQRRRARRARRRRDDMGASRCVQSRDHGADRRALELRAAELTARTLAPGSALACLDAVAGENVEAACEKALFASAGDGGRRHVLCRGAARAAFGHGRLCQTRRPRISTARCCRCAIRSRPIASVSSRTRLRCATAAPARIARRSTCLHDPSRVRANLSGQTLDRYLDHYLTAWAQPPDGPGPVADAATQSQPTYQPGAPGQHKVVNIDFPTAASIPAVSIMNPEPGTKPTAAAAARCGQSKSAGASCRSGIGAAVETIAQAGRQSAGASSCSGRRAGARGGGRATGPGLDAGPSSAACAGGGDGSGTGGELRHRRSRAAHPVRVAAVSSTDARCR